MSYIESLIIQIWPELMPHLNTFSKTRYPEIPIDKVLGPDDTFQKLNYRVAHRQ